MKKRLTAIAALGVATVASAIALSSAPNASAAVPVPVAGNVTILNDNPRLAPAPGTAFNAGETKVLQVSGKFGVPADATGVVLSVSANRSTAAGRLTVWGAAEGGAPGVPTVTFAKGEYATNVSVVSLTEKGEIKVFSSAKANALISVTGYVSPDVAPVSAAPVVKSIDGTKRELINVGGSFRTRSTVLGSVELDAGTYDARVLGSFEGFNNKTDLDKDIKVTGTFALTLGTEVKSDFSNNITVGGIAIPRADSETLTQDPNANISTFFTLTEKTTVQVRVFGYASNSSQQDNVLKAGLDSAKFLKVS
jgi:hypothetical protein